jgi:hypothetical protein
MDRGGSGQRVPKHSQSFLESLLEEEARRMLKHKESQGDNKPWLVLDDLMEIHPPESAQVRNIAAAGPQEGAPNNEAL